MVRNYVKKTGKPAYTIDDLKDAVLNVQNHRMTYREASEAFGVPKTMIFKRVHKLVKKESYLNAGRGRKCVLSKEVEDNIAGIILARSRWGFPVDKAELCELVQQYVTDHKIKTTFKENRPGEDWYRRFMRDHPKISLKKPEQLQRRRMEAADPFVVYDFYEQLKKIIADENLENKPFLIFNCDESGFPTDPSKKKALGEKGKKGFYRVVGGTGRENISVNACVSADGSILPPHIIFKGKAVQPRWIPKANEYPGTQYCATKNGYMEECAFYQWIETAFVPYVDKVRRENNLENQTALLLFDGHRSHISTRLIELALKNNIVLFRFPSHLTHRLQPLDKCVFGPIKTAWDEKLVQHGKRNIGKTNIQLSRDIFSQYIGEIWASVNKDNIVSGFRETGCFPVDETKFPVSEFKDDSLKRYQQLKISESEKVLGEPQQETINLPVEVEINEAENPEGRQNINTLADYFVSKLKSIQTPSTSKQMTQEKQIRLKAFQYGEILTSVSVKERIENEEKKRNMKNSKTKKEPKKKTESASKNKKKAVKKMEISDSSSDDNEEMISLHDSDEVNEDDPFGIRGLSDDENEMTLTNEYDSMSQTNLMSTQGQGGDSQAEITSHPQNYATGDYVRVTYEGRPFPGVIIDIDSNELEISVMKLRKDGKWIWPKPKDQIWYPQESVVNKISRPVFIESANAYIVEDFISG